MGKGSAFKRVLCLAGSGVILAAAGCGRAPVAPPPDASAQVVVEIRAPLAAQAVSRRWQVADIYQYEVSLRRWEGTGFTDLSPPLRLVLPQKDAPRHEARFLNLRHGARYRVDVVAKGNAGGTAPERVLNSETPSGVEFDLTGAQDVSDQRRASVTVRLDPVPFAGTLVLRPLNVPAFVQRFDVALQEAASGVTRYAATFAPDQTMTLTNLKAGIPYTVLLEAYRGNGRLYRSIESDVVLFDPSQTELEQDRVLEIPF
jgi:hypothetical protein